ncbi:MAG TPA: hypothetical protein VLQ46_12840 [Casimicrobiaceae bacterium]|nr:hypothetical protein [Casimicrobiaceae bacterium]
MACRFVCIVLAVLLLAACNRLSESEKGKAARDESLKQAIETSLAEERAKDQAMKEAAAAEAAEHIQKITAEFEDQRAKERPAEPSAEVQAAEDAVRRYTDKLRQSVNDPASMQLRNAAFAPKKNGMCAEFSGRDKSGSFAGFKRVVVTDTAVNPEEPPNRETLTYFLAFQVAARDTGCFPDVLKVHIVQ